MLMTTSNDTDTQRDQIFQSVRRASSGWAQAMQAHKLAPPDAGFAARLRTLAQAAQQEHQAWEQAHAAGLLWRPIPGAENAQPPYELQPGTGRRGPPELWGRFDEAVASLNRAISGSSADAVAAAFGEMAEAADALAGAVESGDGVPTAAAGSAARGAA